VDGRIPRRHNGAALAQMGHCSRNPGAEMLTVPGTAFSALRDIPDFALARR
jgi:hypothetical protein